jgi:hypothetical protein
MKVSELLAKLAEFDPSADIVVQNDNWTPLDLEVQSLGDVPVLTVYGEGEEE